MTENGKGSDQAEAAKWSHFVKRQGRLVPLRYIAKNASPAFSLQAVQYISYEKPKDCPATKLGEYVEIEELYIILAKKEVIGRDGLSPQCPAITCQLAFGFD